MELTIQTSLLNVRDLDQSIRFYRDVFDLRLLARRDTIASLLINETDRRQVLLLHAVEGRYPTRPGRGSIGLRLLALEAGSPDELDTIEGRLVERNALVGRHRTKKWEAIVGVDPDRIEVSVTSSLTGIPVQTEDWTHLDDMVYEIA